MKIPDATFHGKSPDDMVHAPLTCESAATAIGTRTLMSKMRLMCNDAAASAEAQGAGPVPLASHALNWSADQQEHNHAHAEREQARRQLVAERVQKERHLEQLRTQASGTSPEAEAEADLQAQLRGVALELAALIKEQFRLGVSHSAAILGRTAFQVAPWLADWLVLAVPGFQPILSAIVEIKSGFWLTTHLILEHMLVAWTAFRTDLANGIFFAPSLTAAQQVIYY